MKAVIAAAIALGILYFLDQHYYSGMYTRGVVSMTMAVKHGFGF